MVRQGVGGRVGAGIGRCRFARFARLIAVGAACLGLGGGLLVAVSMAGAPVATATPATPIITCTTTPNIFNTGYDAITGDTLSTGSLDAHWQVTGMYPETTPRTTYGLPPTGATWTAAYVEWLDRGGWAASPYDNAQWISQQTGAHPTSGTGDWYYRYQFQLAPTVAPSKFSLSMDFLADNDVAAVFVNTHAQNGLSTGIPQAPSDTPRPYTYVGYNLTHAAATILDHDWQAGTNTLVVQVKSGAPYEGFDAQMRPSALCPVDLAVTQTASSDPYLGGQTLTYHVKVTNGGPGAVSGVTVSDTLPAALATAGFTWTCTATASSSCAASGSGDIADTVTLEPTGALRYTVTGTVPAGTTGTLRDSVTVTPPAGTTDSGCTPDCTTTDVDPAVTVGLRVSETSTPSSYIPGDTLTYVSKVTNAGPTAADAAKVSDPLPSALAAAGFTWTCTATASSSCPASGSGGITDTVTVAVGGTLTYTVTGGVPPAERGSLANAVTVTPPAGTTDSGCTPTCSATDTSSADVTTDLSATSASDPGRYLPGDPLTYTITVTNAGPSDALSATAKDSLPSALAAAGFTWTCTATASSSCPASGSGSFTDTVTVAAGGTLTYTVTGTVPPGTTTALTDTVTVTPPPGTIDTACTPGCSATTSVFKQPPANRTVSLSVAKVAVPDPYVPGSRLTYTVTVTNDGPADADGATVSDPLPAPLAGAGFTWACVASPGSTCTATGSTGIDDTVDLAADGRLVYTVTGTVPVGVTGNLSTTATVTPPPGTNDRACTPSCSAAVTDPQARPALSLTKTAVAAHGDTAPISVGESIAYRYLVTNTGNVPLGTVSVTDPTLGAVACPSATLASGASETCTSARALLVTEADVDAGQVADSATASGVLSNGQRVTSPVSSVVVPTHPRPAVVLVVQATVSPPADQDGAHVGDSITDTYFVTNTGNVPLISIAVHDLSLGTVTCPVLGPPGLAPGATVTCRGEVAHVVTAADVAAGWVTDTATATGTDPQGITSAASAPSVATVRTAPALAPQSGEQPLSSIITGHGPLSPSGPDGAVWGATGGGLLALGVAAVEVRRRRRRAQA